ncbi:MAG: hypothetical protein M3552_15400 [Planctomycetota bacterium]|nr:hypothetical protein [Planctomycetota bacterium]
MSETEQETGKTRPDESGRLIGDDYHRPLRDALADLSDPAAAEQAADLYEKIDRPWEAGLWREHAIMLRQEQPSNPN